jgi:hypothetical protein
MKRTASLSPFIGAVIRGELQVWPVLRILGDGIGVWTSYNGTGSGSPVRPET